MGNINDHRPHTIPHPNKTPHKWKQDVKDLRKSAEGPAPTENLEKITFSTFSIPTRKKHLALPKSIFKQPVSDHLVDLSANNCNLHELSDKIGSLKHLQTLSLKQNNLTCLPHSITSCEQLRTIDLSSNKFTILPLHSCSLPELKHCNLSHNLIQSILFDISFVSSQTNCVFATFPSLETFNLSHNKLHTIDWSVFWFMPSLSHLDLSHNEISTISIPHLPKLVAKNSGQIKYLCSLKKLNLSHNQISDTGNPSCFPGNLIFHSSMSELSYIKLSYNRLTLFPFSVLDLPNLVELNLHNNLITELPPTKHLTIVSDVPSVIIPQFLYLGNWTSATNIKFVEKYKIKYILVVCAQIVKESLEKKLGVEYKFVAAEDTMEYDIDKHFDECGEWIEKAKKEGKGGVLVHCLAGKSRSATIVVGYLMKKNGWSFERALKEVVGSRPLVKPNQNFVNQLKEYEQRLRMEGVIKE
eukprot:TRINITY_DN18789_c0_g1_i1.p1 TRINITY_DN18789_c0_g1~~TRINITY_DN18789_c0_g1_i1.p1  ORF type:complete len:469 (+),score=60.47 TRINITY_DN18789_c0_g1_i1:142-1548(+)